MVFYKTTPIVPSISSNIVCKASDGTPGTISKGVCIKTSVVPVSTAIRWDSDKGSSFANIVKTVQQKHTL